MTKCVYNPDLFIMADYNNISLEEIKGYRRDYKENEFWEKVRKYVRRAKSSVNEVGAKFIYMCLVLYYLGMSRTIFKVYPIIFGALGYFIFPIDLIPDIMPIVGFEDDLSVLLTVIEAVSEFITPEIKSKALEKLDSFYDIDDIPESTLNFEGKKE